MKKTRQGDLMKRAIQVLCVVAAAAVAPALNAQVLDLTSPYPGSGSIVGANGVTAVYSTIDTHPSGTGVFDPFLTIQRKNTEEGYNTSQGGSGQGYLDDKRVPQ